LRRGWSYTGAPKQRSTRLHGPNSFGQDYLSLMCRPLLLVSWHVSPILGAYIADSFFRSRFVIRWQQLEGVSCGSWFCSLCLRILGDTFSAVHSLYHKRVVYYQYVFRNASPLLCLVHTALCALMPKARSWTWAYTKFWDDHPVALCL
jgi:hypothetical protein